MNTEAPASSGSTSSDEGFIRLGGIAGLLLVTLALSLNFLLAPQSPDFNASVADIAAYVSENTIVLAISNALRYVVFFVLPFFGVGLYRFVSGKSEGAHRSWAMVGLLAVIWIPAAGIVANSVETAGIWQADNAAQQPQLVMAIWSISGALFITVQLAWGTLALGFSVAGRMARVVPVWLLGLGSITFASCMIGAVGVLSVMNGGWTQIPAYTSFALFPLWASAMSVLMIRKG